MFFFNKKKKKYVSCDLIEHGMDFFSDSINFCCRIPPHFTGFKKLIPDYHGEILDWKKFFKIKRQFRNQMKQGKMIPECEDCFYLKEKEWDNEDYISFINFNNWTVCNERCIYCNLNDVKQPEQYNVYPAIKDLAEKGYIKPGGHITIAGGEPCVAPEFNDLIEILLEHGIDNIRVLTNATKYSPMVEKGIAKGVINTVISVDSGSKETFIKIKRVDLYDLVWENIRKYASVQIRTDSVKTKFILIPDVNSSEEEIDLWLKKSIEAGIKHVAFDIESEWYLKNQNNIPESILHLVEFTLNKIKEYNLDIELIDRGSIIANRISQQK